MHTPPRFYSRIFVVEPDMLGFRADVRSICAVMAVWYGSANLGFWRRQQTSIVPVGRCWLWW